MNKFFGDSHQVPHPVWRQLAYLNRWQVVRCTLPRSVATHCFYVTLYADHLARSLEMDTEDSHALLRASLYHDLSESVTGDVPSPIKRAMGWDDGAADALAERLIGSPVKFPINPHVKHLLKILDLLEATVHLVNERNSGNAYVTTPLNELRARLMETISNHPPQHVVQSWFDRYNKDWPQGLEWWVKAVLKREDMWLGTSFADAGDQPKMIVT